MSCSRKIICQIVVLYLYSHQIRLVLLYNLFGLFAVVVKLLLLLLVLSVQPVVGLAQRRNLLF